MDDDASTDFKAKYDQPFTLAQAVELDVPILTAGECGNVGIGNGQPHFKVQRRDTSTHNLSLLFALHPLNHLLIRSYISILPSSSSLSEITRLQNSIHHLTLSNAEIETYISTEDDEEDRKEFESVVKENEDVM